MGKGLGRQQRGISTIQSSAYAVPVKNPGLGTAMYPLVYEWLTTTNTKPVLVAKEAYPGWGSLVLQHSAAITGHRYALFDYEPDLLHKPRFQALLDNDGLVVVAMKDPSSIANLLSGLKERASRAHIVLLQMAPRLTDDYDIDISLDADARQLEKYVTRVLTHRGVQVNRDLVRDGITTYKTLWDGTTLDWPNTPPTLRELLSHVYALHVGAHINCESSSIEYGGGKT